MCSVLFIDTICLAMLDFVRAAFEFLGYNPRSSMFNLRFLDATFAAHRLDSSACKYPVSDGVYEWVGSTGVHVFAVHGTMLVDENFEYFS